MTVTSLRPATRAFGATTLLALSVAGVFALYALHSALPSNPIELPFEHALHVRDWFPEGWAFFTAPAQHDMRLPFARASEGAPWVSANAGPNARAENYYGMRRGARLQNLEVEILSEQAPETSWTSCDEANASCFDAAPPVAVKNPTHAPTLCGDVVLVVQKPVPWAWSHLKTAVSMPAKVLRLEVTC
jgi:antimicrobial peptide system SdpA family protein